jgi:hypothetical protein
LATAPEAAATRSEPGNVPAPWPTKSGVLNASLTLQAGSETVVGFGKRTSQTNWNYLGVNTEGLIAIIRSIQTGQPVDRPIRVSYYYEADPSRFGADVQRKLERAGVFDISGRANLTLRPPSAQEVLKTGGGWKVKSADVSVAVEPGNDGVFPFTHPTKNGNAWFAGLTYDEKKGFAPQAIGATALVTLLPGHGKEFDTRVGPINVAGVAYGFNVPLPPGRQLAGSAAAVTNAMSVITGQLPEHTKPLGDVLGAGARAFEAKKIADAADAALFNPREGEAGAALVARGRYIVQHKDLGGLQIEGNGVVLLQSDGRQDVTVLDPAGNVVASVPYDQLMQALQPYREVAQAFVQQSQVVEPLAQGLALRTGTAAAAAWARNLVQAFRPGAPANEALGAVRDVIRAGDGKWDDVADLVGGWKRLAEGVGGWSTLAKEMGGWGQLAKNTGGWTALAKAVGGPRALASAMGGWSALRAVAGQTVYFAAMADTVQHVGRRNEISQTLNEDGFPLDPVQAQQLLNDIEVLQSSPLSHFDLLPVGWQEMKDTVLRMHPQLREGAVPPPTRTREAAYNNALNRVLTVLVNEPSGKNRQALNDFVYEATRNPNATNVDPWVLQAAREALEKQPPN